MFLAEMKEKNYKSDPKPPTATIDVQKLVPLTRTAESQPNAFQQMVAARSDGTTFAYTGADPNKGEEKSPPDAAVVTDSLQISVRKICEGTLVKKYVIEKSQYYHGRCGRVSADGKTCIVHYNDGDEYEEHIKDLVVCEEDEKDETANPSKTITPFDVENFESKILADYAKQETGRKDSSGTITMYTKNSPNHLARVGILEKVIGEKYCLLEQMVEEMKNTRKYRVGGLEEMDSQGFFTEVLKRMLQKPGCHYYVVIVWVKEGVAGDEANEMVSKLRL